MMMQSLAKTLVRSPKRLVLGRSLSTSPYAQFEMAPVDPIVGLNEIFQKDDYPQKVIVGVGAYRDDVRWEMVTRRILYIFNFKQLFSNYLTSCHYFISFFPFIPGWKSICSSVR